MNLLEFVASLIGNLLSWPVAVGFVVWLLRKPIAELIGRVQTIESGKNKATFGDQIEVAEDSARDALKEVEDDLLLAGETPPPPPQDEQGPGNAMSMLKAWAQLETALRELYGAAGLASSGPGRPPLPAKMAQMLFEARHVNSAFVRSVEQLQDLRNQVAHGRHDPTTGEVAAFVEMATDLDRAARFFTRRIAKGES